MSGRAGFVPCAVATGLLSLVVGSGCRGPGIALPDGLAPGRRMTRVRPGTGEVAGLEEAMADYAAAAGSPAAATGEPAGLRECVELAWRHNRALQRLACAAARQREAVAAAWREVLGSSLTARTVSGDNEGTTAAVSVDADWRGLLFEPFIEYAHRPEDPASPHSSSFGIAVSRSLFRIREDMRRRLPVTRATRDFHAALNQRLLELRKLRLSVARAYYGVQNLARRVEIRQTRLEDAENFLAAVKVKVDNGFAAPIEETNARISLNQAQADLVREKTNLQNAREQLLDLLGLGLDHPLDLREDEVEAPAEVRLDLDRDRRLVLAGHEEIRNKLLEMEVFRQERLVRREERLPEVRVGVETRNSQQGRSAFGSGTNSADSVDFTVELSMPLDGFGAERARARQDDLRLRELGLELVDVQRDLEKRLRANYRDVTRWSATVNLARERLRAERRKLEATLKRYESGDTDNLEATRAKQAVDDAKVALLDATVNHILALAEYAAMIPPARP